MLLNGLLRSTLIDVDVEFWNSFGYFHQHRTTKLHITVLNDVVPIWLRSSKVT